MPRGMWISRWTSTLAGARDSVYKRWRTAFGEWVYTRDRELAATWQRVVWRRPRRRWCVWPGAELKNAARVYWVRCGLSSTGATGSPPPAPRHRRVFQWPAHFPTRPPIKCGNRESRSATATRSCLRNNILNIPYGRLWWRSLSCCSAAVALSR